MIPASSPSPSLPVREFVLCFLFAISLSTGQERCNAPFEHICKSDGRCISSENVCDGTRDCFDGSDETSNLCLNRPCSQTIEHVHQAGPFDILTLGTIGSSQSFRCSYGACITKQFTCNGIDNCHDGSDESYKTCKDVKCKINEFKCDYGACINSFSICNGVQNCHDGSDETSKLCLRLRRTCLSNRNFKCDYGGCIPKFWKCDGRAQCPDLSDEKSCGSNHTFKPYSTIRVEKRNEAPPPAANVPTGITGVTSGCQQVTANEEAFQTFSCGEEDSVCLGSGLLPSGTIIVVECKDAVDSLALECQDDGLWHPLDYPGKAPSPIICQGEGVATQTGCVGAAAGGTSARVLICGQGGNCDGGQIFPTGTFIISNCGVAGDPAVLECKEDTLWHMHQEEIAPIFETCTAPSRSGRMRGCPRGSAPNTNFEVLTCGSTDRSCDSGTNLPRGTVISARCSRSISGGPYLLQCYSDNKWHQLGDDPGPPMVQVCQYEIPQIQDCGSRKETSIKFSWTWLVGLLRNNQFACTGTLISPTLIVTGGHCVVRNQDTNDVISADELVIQHAIPGGRSIQSKVESIRLYPRYSGGEKPSFDLALIRLKHPALRSQEILPACVDTAGALINRVSLAFNRSAGEEVYSWTPFPQTLDVTCFNKGSICSRHLRLDDYQFCGVNEDSNLYLHPGSSGGPYLINLGTPPQEKWAIAGIVSYSVQTKDDLSFCKRPHTVFLSVNKFHDWITKCGYEDQCGL